MYPRLPFTDRCSLDDKKLCSIMKCETESIREAKTRIEAWGRIKSSWENFCSSAVVEISMIENFQLFQNQDPSFFHPILKQPESVFEEILRSVLETSQLEVTFKTIPEGKLLEQPKQVQLCHRCPPDGNAPICNYFCAKFQMLENFMLAESLEQYKYNRLFIASG